MESIQLSQLWTAAAVLAGFQVTALTWRLNREVAMEAEGRKNVGHISRWICRSFLPCGSCRSVRSTPFGCCFNRNGC